MEESKQNQCMLDLKNNQYDRETLKKHIYELNLWDILRTQKIDVTFAVRYILNPKYQLSDSEQNIDIKDVLFFQQHLDKKRLEIEMFLYNSDDDSVATFEKVAQE